MAYSEISKLKSIVFDGFLMNGVLSLLKGTDISLNIEERHLIIKNALTYISKIKLGRNFMNDGIYIENLEESSKAYTIAIEALELYEKEKYKRNLTDKRFDEIISLCEADLNGALENDEINIEKLDIAISLFNLIRVILLKKADMILPKEKEIFL